MKLAEHNLGEIQDRSAHLIVICQDRADAEDIVAFTRDRSRPL